VVASALAAVVVAVVAAAVVVVAVHHHREGGQCYSLERFHGGLQRLPPRVVHAACYTRCHPRNPLGYLSPCSGGRSNHRLQIAQLLQR